ncbi:MAG: hypothetical protein JWQ72_576 [Polaromonas sp.]|nr:hypothetical protein [Polaromonas sp.]
MHIVLRRLHSLSFRVPLSHSILPPKGRSMSRRLAAFLVVVLMAALLVGTQIPGGWRDGIEHSVHAPSTFSSWAHFALFFGMALLLSIQPLGMPAVRVGAIMLGLALVTEGLQFFAVARHPRLSDVVIDMAGALLAITLVRSFEKRSA